MGFHSDDLAIGGTSLRPAAPAMKTWQGITMSDQLKNAKATALKFASTIDESIVQNRTQRSKRNIVRAAIPRASENSLALLLRFCYNLPS
jgi:hypothetical protein